MEHFIAYHSVQTMGRKFELTGRLNFLSRKFGLLKKALGNTVWVVQGIPLGKKTAYYLCGAYRAEHVDIEDALSSLYVIDGPSIKVFEPPIRIDGLEWFPVLRKTQSNFSLGFNRINDPTVLQYLLGYLVEEHPPGQYTLPDIDLIESASEGSLRLKSHLYRERNRALIEAKRASILKTQGRLCCEVCGFDFEATYGEIGKGFCEVHHLTPLSKSNDSVITTLEDLVIVCSNCHRMIHRADPMLAISQLSKMLRR